MEEPYLDQISFWRKTFPDLTRKQLKENKFSREYWRERAEKDLSIPPWYFDLYHDDHYVDGKVAAIERYLDCKVYQDFSPEKYFDKTFQYSKEKSFFYAFFFQNPEIVKEKISEIATRHLEKYVELRLTTPLFFPFYNFNCSEILRHELERRNPKPQTSVQEYVSNRKKLKDGDATQVVLFVEKVERKLRHTIREGRYERIFEILEESSKLSNIPFGTLEYVCSIAVFEEAPYEFFLLTIETFYDKSLNPEVLLWGLCHVISSGNMNKVDSFLAFAKEKGVDLINLFDKEFCCFNEKVRTFGQVVSLFACFSNNLAMYERFADWDQPSKPHHEDYSPIDQNLKVLYLVVGYLRKRDPVSFYQILLSEDLVWTLTIQSLIVISANFEAIYLMKKSCLYEKNQISLMYMAYGNPLVECQLMENVPSMSQMGAMFSNALSNSFPSTFLEILTKETCGIPSMTEDLGLGEDFLDKMLKAFGKKA